MRTKITAFVAATAAVLAVAIGWQAFGASSGEENKDPRPPAVSTETPSTTPSDGSTEAPSDGTTDGGEKSDDGERDGFTDDHTGKPGENK